MCLNPEAYWAEWDLADKVTFKDMELGIAYYSDDFALESVQQAAMATLRAIDSFRMGPHEFDTFMGCLDVYGDQVAQRIGHHLTRLDEYTGKWHCFLSMHPVMNSTAGHQGSVFASFLFKYFEIIIVRAT